MSVTPPEAPPVPTPPPTGQPATGEPADPDKPLGPPGEKALEEWKARARDAERKSKAAEARLAEIADREKSDTERLAGQVEKAEARAAQLRDRAVRAEVRALAAGTFADPSDAAAFLDVAKYAGDDGEIDTDAIETDLKDLLARKPHLAKTTTAGKPPAPKPDPSQGSRGGAPLSGREAGLAEARKRFGAKPAAS